MTNDSDSNNNKKNNILHKECLTKKVDELWVWGLDPN
jgi:hypothetical protein